MTVDKPWPESWPKAEQFKTAAAKTPDHQFIDELFLEVLERLDNIEAQFRAQAHADKLQRDALLMRFDAKHRELTDRHERSRKGRT